MEHVNCPYHTDHNNRLRKLEEGFEDLDGRFVELDKEHAVSKTEMIGSLKSLQSLPGTLSKITETMIAIESEIKNSNERIGRIESKVSQVDEEGTFNIRLWIKQNWIGISAGLAILLYILAEYV